MTSSTKLTESLEAALAPIAETTRAAVDAWVCVISLSDPERPPALVCSAGSDPAWETAARAVIAALAVRRELQEQGADASSFLFAGAELAAICAGSPRLIGKDVRAAASARSVGGSETRAAIIASGERTGREMEAAAALACQAALAVVVAAERNSSRDFWRERAAQTLEKTARARSEFEELKRDLECAEHLLTRGAGLGSRERYAAFGAMVASEGPFDGWVVALAAGKGLEVAASSRPEEVVVFDQPSALGKSYAEQSVLARPGFASSAGACQEDRIFGRPYVCVPFEDGAIALASRTPISEGLRTRVQEMVRRLASVVKSWWLEDELGRTRELVRQLGLRMFAAIDDERSRIARDLHDDQAQLLTAAQIALQGGRDEARGIFKRLETELRRRVRELRPARLGEAGLEQALRAELGRLSEAGIKVRLSSRRRGDPPQLSRPVEELCYQVAREALSNVLRHSGATRVEVAVERRQGSARISIADNGRGIAAAPGRIGMGLEGLRERLELMGGSFRIKSKPGATRLVAEIPELD